MNIDELTSYVLLSGGSVTEKQDLAGGDFEYFTTSLHNKKQTISATVLHRSRNGEKAVFVTGHLFYSDPVDDLGSELDPNADLEKIVNAFAGEL